MMARPEGSTVAPAAVAEVTATPAPGVRRSHLDPLAASLQVLLCLSWGLNHVAVKVTNEGLQPVFQAGLRSLAGCGIVYLWCRFRGIDLFRRDGTLPGGLLAGALFGVEFILIYVALDYTTVSRGIVFLYTMPFIVALGAHVLIPGERLTPLRWFGLLAAFAGVALAFSDGLSLASSNAWIGDLLFMAGAVAWAFTTLTIRTTRLDRAPPEKVLIYQLALGAVIPLSAAPLFGPLLREPSALTAIAFAYQTLVVVTASYLAWFWLLSRYPAPQLSAFTFLTPMFAAGFGAILLHEPVSPVLLAALVLVAAGIVLVNWRTR
jgi:drug/metabolite transporter (DMT)-like permease